MAKTIVIGMDGANWDLIEPWLADGTLPNIAALREQSSWGDMLSELPTVTVPNWKCYSTGKNPGKLGVYRFDHIDTKRRTFTVHTSRSFKSSEYWDYLNKDGIKTGVINMPTTFPPRNIDGFMVSGGPDAVEGEFRSNNIPFTYPEKIQSELLERFNYRIHPEPMISSGNASDATLDCIYNMVESRFKTAEYLMEKFETDFTHITFFYTQALQHFYFDAAPVRKVWTIVDSHIGDYVDRGYNIIIMSDHGIAKVHTNFYINEWLIQNGYLSIKKSLGDFLLAIGITRERLLKITNALKLTALLGRITPSFILKLIPWNTGVRKNQILNKINWEKSRIIGSTLGPLYFIDPDDTLRNEIIDKLKNLNSPYTEAPVFKDVFKREEIYSGPCIDSAPGLVALQNDGVHVNDGIGRGNIFSRKGHWVGENIRKGFFLFSGENVKAGHLETPVKITDLAPTILHMNGSPVPEDMDGKVLDIFNEESKPEYCRPIEINSETSANDGDEIEKRLSDLGYL